MRILYKYLPKDATCLPELYSLFLGDHYSEEVQFRV